jgi:hypothetical protein
MNYFKELFTPLVDKKYCNYFYYLSVISYFIFIFIVLSFVLMVLFHSKKLNLYIISNFISIIISVFLMYFVNRLMYSMCVKSL